MSNWDQDDIRFLSTMDVKIIDHSGSDHSVANAARVSVLGDDVFKIAGRDEKERGLINFLMKNRHGTPFEHNSMTFFVKAPIFVFREFHRHRVGFSYNEMSGRYTELHPEFYIPAPNRPFVQFGKPGHYEFKLGDPEIYQMMVQAKKRSYMTAWKSYQQQLVWGVAKEIARTDLPVGIYSQMYVTCNMRSLMSFLSLRTKREDSTFPSYPQAEIEMVADQMEEFAKQLFPVTLETFDNNGRVAP
jgi:thymidylate synthase (FAD)